MFRHDRVYRAIAFSGPDVCDLSSVRSLFPKKTLSSAEPAVGGPHYKVEHHFYYSTSEFTRNIDLLQKAKIRWNGVEQYKYNIYFAGIQSGRQLTVILAVPFWRMAREVYSHLRNATRGRDVVYKKISLTGAFEADKKVEALAVLLKISRVNYSIEGDGTADSLQFIGNDLAHCSTLDTLKVNLKGPSLVPQSIRIAYKKSFEERFSLEVDKFGHYRFRVSKSGKSFPCLTEVFRALAAARLIQETSAFPHMGLGEPDDELGEAE